MTDRHHNGPPPIVWALLFFGLAIIVLSWRPAYASTGCTPAVPYLHVQRNNCYATLSEVGEAVQAERLEHAGAYAAHRYELEYRGIVDGPAHQWWITPYARLKSDNSEFAYGRHAANLDFAHACDGLDTNTGECPNTCDGINTGDVELVDWQPSSAIPSQGICDPASWCNYVPVDQPFCHSDTVSGTQICTLALEKTADNCTLPTHLDMDQNQDGAKCVNVGGDLLCKDPDDPNQGQNCGYFNDQYICLGAMPTGNCIFLGDGGMACDSTAGSPPAPDDGVTAGTPAPPDAQLSDGTNTTNLYNAGTVGGSSGNPSGTDGNVDSGGNPLDGSQGEEGTGSGSASGDCSVPPTCTGDAIQCAILEQQWHSACQDVGTDAGILADTGLTGFDDVEGQLGSTVDLDTSLDDAGFLGPGACAPDIPMNLGYFGSYTIPLTDWCPLFSFIGVLVLISGGIVSLRIIAGGF